MNTVSIVGIVVENRADKADEVQNIITKYGDSVIARMGVPSKDRYTGIITVTLEAEVDRAAEFVGDLKSIEGVSANFCTV